MIDFPGKKRSLDPFYDLRFSVASEYPRAMVLSGIPADQPVFVARARMDAPYPDAEFVIPVSKRAVASYLRGDRSVMATLTQELLEQFDLFLNRLKS